MNRMKIAGLFAYVGAVALIADFAACSKSSTSSAAAPIATTNVPTTTTNPSPTDATAAVNEQLAAESVSNGISGVVPAATLGPVNGTAVVNCVPSGQASIAYTWTNVLNSTTIVSGDYYRLWTVSAVHTLTNCTRRGYVINGTFTETMNPSTTAGSTYLYRRRVVSSNFLVNSTGTYNLSGSNISVTGNNLSTSTIHLCSLSGDVQFDREDTSNSTTISVTDQGLTAPATPVVFCGTTYSFTTTKSVVTTAE